ncbi:unnamed protein product [Knipowitschia caucasica]
MYRCNKTLYTVCTANQIRGLWVYSQSDQRTLGLQPIRSEDSGSTANQIRGLWVYSQSDQRTLGLQPIRSEDSGSTANQIRGLWVYSQSPEETQEKPGLSQVWARSGPGLGQVWARSGPGLGQVWARSGPGVEQELLYKQNDLTVRVRSGSESGLDQSPALVLVRIHLWLQDGTMRGQLSSCLSLKAGVCNFSLISNQSRLSKRTPLCL